MSRQDSTQSVEGVNGSMATFLRRGDIELRRGGKGQVCNFVWGGYL